MPRLMSVAMTTDAVIERRKTVTRRKGWWLDKNGRRILHAGDRLTLCRKVQGRKPGEPLERLAEVQVVNVRRQMLCAVAGPYGLDADGRTIWPEVIAEGFPDMHPHDFMDRFFVDAQGIGYGDDVTRIEWRYLDEGWRDNQGDIWHEGADGLMHTPETAPFPREHVERKWGPLVLVPDPIQAAHNTSREDC